MSFPQGFIWGAASASYQTEGAWDADGKGLSIWDEFSHRPDTIKNRDTGDIAADAYHCYKEDIQLMKEIGLNACRFSLSWARIIPNGRGEINEKGLQFYDNYVDELLKAGITPWMTLYHWDLPAALQKEGGWLNRNTAEAFGEFAAIIARHFKGRVTHFMTLNEPQIVVSHGHQSGVHAPGLRLEQSELLLAMHHLLIAHGLAVSALRENSGAEKIQVGYASTGRLCYPQTDTPQNRETARKATFATPSNDWIFTHSWFGDAAILGRCPSCPANSSLSVFANSIPESDWKIIKQPLDFLGLNVYHGEEVDSLGQATPKFAGFPKTALKWPITPEVMRFGPIWLNERYDLPIVITENGLSCNDRIFLDGKVHDPARIDFLSRYLACLEKSIAEGAPVKGFFHWCFTDNFEWSEGYDERFGLVYVDYPTVKRTLKESAFWYRKVIERNGLN